MTTYQIFENLLELNQEASNELIKTYFNESGKKTSLVFPRTRNGELRVSEQELRVAMINLFELNNYAKLTYSVETPTEQVYVVIGNDQRSGSLDLSFYEDNMKFLNVKCKAHNSAQESIKKDIEKLVNEDYYGAWCHIFKNEDAGTLERVFDKLRNAFIIHGCPKKPLYFSFLILEKRKLITRKGMDSDLIDFDPDQIFNLKYDEHFNLPDINTHIGNWQINHYR